MKSPKTMSFSEMMSFILACNRLECDDEHYSKGVRVALIALGYDEDWVNRQFREAYETYYCNGCDDEEDEYDDDLDA